MTLRNSSLLYRPSLSIWQARKKDKAASSEVTENAGAKAGAANVNKALLPDNPKLEAIVKWGNQFRDFIYTNTLPWDDGGWRIGHASKHMEFMMKTGDMRREGERLVEEFMADYAAAIEQARFTLNDLFDPADYPGEDEVRAKFRFTLDVQTLASADDFRLIDGVPQDEVDLLVATATANAESRVKEAMETAFGRLFDVVQKFSYTLEQYGSGGIKKFNDTLVGNITELVEAMPALNIIGDPKLNALTDKARELAAYAAMDLRKKPEVRDAAIKEAQELVKLFAPADDAPVTGQVVEPTKSPRKPPAPPLARTTVTSPEPVKTSVRDIFADML